MPSGSGSRSTTTISISWRRTPDLNRELKILQTRALPFDQFAHVVSRKASRTPVCLILWTVGIYHTHSFYSFLIRTQETIKIVVLWCPRRGSHSRRLALQANALLTELPRHKLQRQSDVPSLIVNGLDFTHTVYSGR